MAKMDVEALETYRKAQKIEMTSRKGKEETVQIVTGAGTCGVAAGADEVISAFKDAIKENDLQGVEIKKTGCMGLCYAEPTVEVRIAGQPRVIYGNVNKSVAETIVEKHIMRRELVDGHLFDAPAADILKQEEDSEA